MDTNDFINLLQDKYTAEKVLDALEGVKNAVAVRIYTPGNHSAYDILRIINFHVNQARRKYKKKTDAYISAAQQVAYEAAIEKPCVVKEHQQ